MHFVTLVYRNLRRRTSRSTLTILGLAVSVGCVVSLVGIAWGFKRSYYQLYEGHGVDIIVMRSGGADPLASSINQAVVEKIANLRIGNAQPVHEVTPLLMETVGFPEYDVYSTGVQGVPFNSRVLRDIKLIDGRTLQEGDTNAAMLGKTLAANLNKKVGDEVTIAGSNIRVIGIFETTNVYENGAMFVPIQFLQDLMFRQNQVTWINLSIKNPDELASQPLTDEQREWTKAQWVEATCKAIEAMQVGEGQALSAQATDDFIQSDVRIKAAGAMAWLTSFIAILVGTISMMNTMVMSVFERTGEIGILRAVGWRRHRVVRMILLEALLLSLAGAILGALGAWGLTWVLGRMPAVNGAIDTRIDPLVVVVGFAIALVIGLFGAAYPAFRASKLMPTVALRHGD